MFSIKWLYSSPLCSTVICSVLPYFFNRKFHILHKMCVYICIHSYSICVCVCVYIYTHAQHTQICIYPYTYISIYIDIIIHIHVYSCTYIYIDIHIRMYMYIGHLLCIRKMPFFPVVPILCRMRKLLLFPFLVGNCMRVFQVKRNRLWTPPHLSPEKKT